MSHLKKILCVGSINKVQVENLGIGNVKFELSPGSVGNGQEILVMPYSYIRKNNCTYCAIIMVQKSDFEGVYVKSKVKL